MKKFSGQESFTIIETLVAIAILMIAVAGPLVAASRGLAAAIYAKDQSVATFLAQEGMELIRNTKDTAIYIDPSGDPNVGFNTFLHSPAFGPYDMSATFGSCSDSQPCGIWYNQTYLDINTCGLVNSCTLYQNGDTVNSQIDYLNLANGNTAGNTPTIFKRQFYITPINSTDVQVTVIVSWNEKTISNAVTLTSEMTASII